LKESPGITIKRADRRFGPYSPEEILVRYREKRFLATDLACVAGSDAGEPLGLVMKRLGLALPGGLVDGDASPRDLVPLDAAASRSLPAVSPRFCSFSSS
jgi:hypothetical protein